MADCRATASVAKWSGDGAGGERALQVMSIAQLAKITSHARFDIKIPDRDSTEDGRVDNRAPHDRVMNQVERAKG